jgi:hypothetical protein
MKVQTITMATVLALSLAFAGVASAAVVPVTSLTGDWSATGTGVAMTDHGVHFGPYAGPGAPGGDVKDVGVDGTLNDLTDLTYTARYNTSSYESKSAPYLRIYFADGKDAIYDPSSNGAQDPTYPLSENVNHTRNVLAPTALWRYDDDPGNGYADSTESQGWMDPSDGEPSGYGIYGAPVSKLLEEHGTDQIAFIAITDGWQFGDMNEAVLTRMRVNSDEFIFGRPGRRVRGAQPVSPEQPVPPALRARPEPLARPALLERPASPQQR